MSHSSIKLIFLSSILWVVISMNGEKGDEVQCGKAPVVKGYGYGYGNEDVCACPSGYDAKDECTLKCDGNQKCKGFTLKGSPMNTDDFRVDCDGDQGCADSKIKGGGARDLKVSCRGSQVCSKAHIDCNVVDDCEVRCGGAKGDQACEELFIQGSNAPGDVELTCDGSGYAKEPCKDVKIECGGYSKGYSKPYAKDTICKITCRGTKNACDSVTVTKDPFGECECVAEEGGECPKNICVPKNGGGNGGGYNGGNGGGKGDNDKGKEEQRGRSSRSRSRSTSKSDSGSDSKSQSGKGRGSGGKRDGKDYEYGGKYGKSEGGDQGYNGGYKNGGYNGGDKGGNGGGNGGYNGGGDAYKNGVQNGGYNGGNAGQNGGNGGGYGNNGGNVDVKRDYKDYGYGDKDGKSYRSDGNERRERWISYKTSKGSDSKSGSKSGSGRGRGSDGNRGDGDYKNDESDKGYPVYKRQSALNNDENVIFGEGEDINDINDNHNDHITLSLGKTSTINLWAIIVLFAVLNVALYVCYNRNKKMSYDKEQEQEIYAEE